MGKQLLRLCFNSILILGLVTTLGCGEGKVKKTETTTQNSVNGIAIVDNSNQVVTPEENQANTAPPPAAPQPLAPPIISAPAPLDIAMFDGLYASDCVSVANGLSARKIVEFNQGSLRISDSYYFSASGQTSCEEVSYYTTHQTNLFAAERDDPNQNNGFDGTISAEFLTERIYNSRRRPNGVGPQYPQPCLDDLVANNTTDLATSTNCTKSDILAAGMTASLDTTNGTLNFDGETLQKTDAEYSTVLRGSVDLNANPEQSFLMAGLNRTVSASRPCNSSATGSNRQTFQIIPSSGQYRLTTQSYGAPGCPGGQLVFTTIYSGAYRIGGLIGNDRYFLHFLYNTTRSEMILAGQTSSSSFCGRNFGANGAGKRHVFNESCGRPEFTAALYSFGNTIRFYRDYYTANPTVYYNFQ